MQDIVTALVKPLVDEPSQFRVTQTEDARVVTITVHVAASDMGKVIGRGGRVANAIRTVARSLQPRDGRRLQIEFTP